MKELKFFIESLGGKPVLVYGIGKSGLSTVRALVKAGADLWVGDDREENVSKAVKLGAKPFLNDMSMDGYAFLVLSPGIPFTHPEPHDIVKKAHADNVEIICDIELFSRVYPDQKIIGVTGTNGKSTTVTLIAHMVQSCGQHALLGGNIGTPVFDLKVKKDNTIVVEMSSFQIDLCPVFRPSISVLLNITPDHLDRHGTMANYVAVKERIGEVGLHSDPQSLIIATDDDDTKKIYARMQSSALEQRSLIHVSTERKINDGVCVNEGVLYDNGVQIGSMQNLPSLKGEYNYQNAVASYAVGVQLGFEINDIWNALVTFEGLDHRQFLVRTINGVTYINDSKATNAAAAAVALSCRRNVYWIVGGRKKKNGLDGLEEFFPHIKHAFIIGEAVEDFAQWFDKYGIEYTRSGTLDTAVIAAHKMGQDNRGQPGGAGVVLLSPACASFDQFENFEVRGNHFTDLVNKLEDTI